MTNKDFNINWKLTSEEIQAKTLATIKDARLTCNKIAALKEFNAQSTLAQLNEMERIFNKELSVFILLSRTSADKSIRDACSEAVGEFNKFQIETKMRKDLFDVFQKLDESTTDELDSEYKRYLKKSINEGKRNGLHLNDSTREKIKELKNRISDLELTFSKNVNEENGKFPFKRDQLDGVPEDVLNGLEKNENGEYLATLKYTVYFPIMKNCSVAETRHKMYIEFNTRCVNANTLVFEEIAQLRHQLANLLGYENHSSYILEITMAKNPNRAQTFLVDMIEKMRPLYHKENEILLKLKKEECEKRNVPFDGKINQSDVKYYINLLEKTEFDLDHAKLQEYFPLDVVFNGIFNIYQTLLGLDFEHVPDAVAFHDEVKLYKVVDKETKGILGFFYADMFPREGKFGHAAIFSCHAGCQMLNGDRQLPVCTMVCNFTKPTNEKPALLDHNEVRTFFHEFGHVMHHICATAKMFKFSGTSVETDFVEAPSQMLENWVWEKESLIMMSKHYKDGTAIDGKLFDNLIRSRLASSAHVFTKYATAALIDLKIHQSSQPDTKKIYQECIKEYLLKDVEDESLNMVPSFEHLVGGYDSKYYGYMWSEVYSLDMFDSRFKKEGILNSKTGQDYRKCILQPGGSKDGGEMLLDFIGREPNENAFLRQKGIAIQ